MNWYKISREWTVEWEQSTSKDQIKGFVWNSLDVTVHNKGYLKKPEGTVAKMLWISQPSRE